MWLVHPCPASHPPHLRRPSAPGGHTYCLRGKGSPLTSPWRQMYHDHWQAGEVPHVEVLEEGCTDGRDYLCLGSLVWVNWPGMPQVRRDRSTGVSTRSCRYQDMCPQGAESQTGAGSGLIVRSERLAKQARVLKLWRWETSQHSGDPVTRLCRPRLG